MHQSLLKNYNSPIEISYTYAIEANAFHIKRKRKKSSELSTVDAVINKISQNGKVFFFRRATKTNERNVL